MPPPAAASPADTPAPGDEPTTSYPVSIHVKTEAALETARTAFAKGSLPAGPAAVAAFTLPPAPEPGPPTPAAPPPHPHPYPPPPFDPGAALARLGTGSLGHIMLAARALPSTQTLLQNAGPAIPSGTVAVADTQLAGRGRAGNVWASPPGCLMASLSVSAAIPGTRLPYVQYAVALGLVRGVKAMVAASAAAAGWGAAASSAAGEACDVRIKWPNDVLAAPPPPASPASGAGGGPRPARKKLAGVLCHSTYVSGPGGSGPGGGGSFRVVAGFGLNVTNEAPGTATSASPAALDWARVADLVPWPPPGREAERTDPGVGRAAAVEAAGGRPALLAAILGEVEAGLDRLAAPGGGDAGAAWGPGGPDSTAYLAAWLHTGQAVTVVDPPDGAAAAGAVDRRGGPPPSASAPPGGERRPPPGAVVRITGLAPSGYLLAVDEASGVAYELHPDGNSLDFMQGLVRRKVVQ